MLETKEKGLRPHTRWDGSSYASGLLRVGGIVGVHPRPYIKGVDLRLGGGLPSNLEIGVVINFNWKVGILVKQNFGSWA